MIHASLRAAFLAVMAFTVAQLSAQTQSPSLTVGPGVLAVGKTAKVEYHNPAMAGQTVVIDVDNGLRHRLETDVISIVLDRDGRGSANWTVPKWFGANFNAPGVTEVHRAIL